MILFLILSFLIISIFVFLKDVMEFLKLILQRKMLFNIMKWILYIAPIFIITNNIYIGFYGRYDVANSIQKAISYIFTKQNISALLIFSLIFFLEWIIEKYILPFVVIHTIRKLNDKILRKADLNSYKNYKEKIGFNIWDKIKEMQEKEELGNNLKYELIESVMFLPMILILWIIAINALWYYMLIIPIVVAFFFLFKVINSLFIKYKIS